MPDDFFLLPPVPQRYDPVAVFTEVFADAGLARDLAEALTCDEVNVLAGLLAASAHLTSAEQWLAAHRTTCGHRERH